MIQHDCIIICYPGGAGGSFLQGAINSSLDRSSLIINQNLGHCHANKISTANFVSGDSLASFEQELMSIKTLTLSLSQVLAHHYRNMIALQHQGIEQNVPTWFIKINVDPASDAEVEFASQMLYRKTTRLENLSQLYHQIRHESWPPTVEEYLKFDPEGNAFLDTVRHSLKSWYWVENHYTQERTINLSLKDIFLDSDLATKLSPWFEPSFVEKFKKSHEIYIETNRRLHPDLYHLIQND